MVLMHILALTTGLAAAAPTNATQYCKPIPGSSDWPAESQWQALNSSVAGRLSAVLPPGIACQPDQPLYDNATCLAVQSSWTNSTWHAQNPFTTDYNDGCAPNGSLPCLNTSYPVYVLSAENAADVQAGVKFAADTGVRLTVKATGHDFPGRSKGANALSIWTHNLRGIEIIHGDPRAAKYGAPASIKLGAGMRWGEVYQTAAKNNITVVGGADPNVGVMGWVTNGGHSPVSSVYGMGPDQVLELEVVTPDGEFRTVNETCYPDLFFALRGGGGSTYAVVTSVTMKAYPSLSGSFYAFMFNTTSGSDTFYSLAAYFHTQLPALSEAGAMGYYYILNTNGNPDPAQNAMLAGGFFIANRSKDQALALVAPVEAAINSSSWAKDPIFPTSIMEEVPDFMTFWSTITQPEAVGTDGRLGSWILDGAAMSPSNFDNLKSAMSHTAPLPWSLIGHLVAGPGARNAPASTPGGPGSDAVLPAWRRGYAHLVAPRSWLPNNATMKAQVTTDLRENVVPALKALAPDSGAYINEADPSNPDWKTDYYGEHYDRLLEVKRKWDPKGVFWCKPCVGWDDGWEIRDGLADEDVLEWGIGNGAGRLCRTGA